MNRNMRKQIFLGCVIVLLHCAVCDAQDNESTRKPITLPGTFSVFSEADVLGRIFDRFDPKTRQATLIQTIKPHRLIVDVSIQEAKVWKVNGNEYLIVLSDLGNIPIEMCGNCGWYTPLAVLKKDGSRLKLVARQDLPKISETSKGPAFGPFDSLSYGRHEGVVLDVAPYNLNSREMLIGARVGDFWMPLEISNTTLYLYRIEGQRLRRVFKEVVDDHQYPNLNNGGPPVVIKTSASFSAAGTGQRFYDLAITRSTVRCVYDETYDCGPNSRDVKQVKSKKELWRFDGQRFNRVGTHKTSRSKKK
jgi:hypothetical protein